MKEKQIYWSQYMAVISATIVSTIAGINFAWPSPSIPKLLKDEYHFNITSDEASYIAIIAPLGNVIGGPLSAVVVDLIGRKITILSCAIPQIISFIFIYFSSKSLWLLYVARFLGGFAEGINFTIMAIYIGEIAHPSIRGTLGSYLSLTIRMGILLINIVGSYFTIETTALISLILPLLFLISFIWMPESPYYLLMKHQVSDARKSLQFLRQKRDIDDELTMLRQDVHRQLSESGNLLDLFIIKTNRKAFIVAFGLRSFQQLSGISAFSLYTQILFKQALGDHITPHTAAIIYATVQFILTFISASVVDKTGRKPLLIITCICCVILLFISGIFFHLRDFYHINLDFIQFLPFILMIGFIISFSLGLGTIVNVMLSELFSTSIKAKALALLNIYFAIIMTITTKFFQITSELWGLTVPFYTFATFCLLGVIFCWLYVPETKGKTLEEIQQHLKHDQR